MKRSTGLYGTSKDKMSKLDEKFARIYPYAFKYSRDTGKPMKKVLPVWLESYNEAFKLTERWETATVTFIRAVQIFKSKVV